MAKKKEEVLTAAPVVKPTEVPDTGLLNPGNAPAAEPEIVIGEVDFNDLLDLERAARGTEEELNKLAGTIFRLSKNQELYLAKERELNASIDVKRKELVKRYKVSEQRQWKIDINTRKVVYSS